MKLSYLFQSRCCMKVWGFWRFKWSIISTLNMSDAQLMNIFEELNRLTFKRQQLTDKRNILALLIQFKKNNGQNEQQYSSETEELKEIDEELKVLTEKKIELENLQERLGGSHLINTTLSTTDSPPSYPAPRVILEIGELPRHSAPTQCPFCRQYVTTEVTTKAGSAAYIVCFISILFCCIAGCCLLPFCLDRCKDVIHRCPKCRSHIQTCKKLWGGKRLNPVMWTEMKWFLELFQLVSSPWNYLKWLFLKDVMALSRGSLSVRIKATFRFGFKLLSRTINTERNM